MPTATLEKWTVCPETYKKTQLREHRALPLMGVEIGKTKNQQDTGTPKFTAALLTNTPLHYTLNILGKRKLDKELVVLMYNGISLSHEKKRN